MSNAWRRSPFPIGHNLSEINHALPTVSRFEAFLQFLKGFEISGIGGWNRIVGQTRKFFPPFVRPFHNASDARLSKSGHRALYRFGASLSFAGYTARKNGTHKYPVTTKWKYRAAESWRRLSRPLLTTDGIRSSFIGNETALIYLWQLAEEGR